MTTARRSRDACRSGLEVSGPPLVHRLLLIAAAIVAMVSAAHTVQRSAEKSTVASIEVVGAPSVIGDEAGVFRTRLLSVGAADRRRPDAHPRTLATYHLLRSFPGAPPRVPHGLTATEFRTNRCNTCHERGGYSQRFGAYAPVNPHPEWTSCLQCHATNASLVGVPFPRASGEEACRQCHTGTPSRFDEAGLDWRAAAFPVVGQSAMVPAIPHDLQTRGTCLTCHFGPGAVAEIRISHPERTNCRQCHLVIDSTAGTFTRSIGESDRAGGATR
jgi:cytochrome c-type protein NapB